MIVYIAVKRKHSFLHIVLALMLLCSQQIGLAHMTSHLGTGKGGPAKNERVVNSTNNTDAESRRAALLAEAVCEQCLALDQVSGAPLLSPSSFVVSNAGGFIAIALASPLWQPAAPNVYLSRAPPSSL